MASEIEITCKEINAGNNIEAYWDRLSELSLASVILFNCRRQGEASKMKVCDFTQGTQTMCTTVMY